MFEIFHNFQKSFSDLISFNVMYDVPSLPWYLTFSADQLSMIMTFIQLLINFLFLFLCCWDNRFFITQIYCKLQQITYNCLSRNQRFLMQNKEQCAKDPNKDFNFLRFVNKSSSFREVERNKMQAFELTQKCINSISELTMNKYKNAKTPIWKWECSAV